MPKRNRANEQRKRTGHVPAPAVESEQAKSARLFAESLRQHAAADKAARDRKAAAVEHERFHAELIGVKEAAAALIRRLRENGRPRQQTADAEAAYRVALAELTEFETGERPHWAPAVVATDDSDGDDVDAAASGEADSAD